MKNILNLKLVILLEYQNITNNVFGKGYTLNWSEKVLVIKEVQNTVPWTYVINELNREEIVGTFYENELQKTN